MSSWQNDQLHVNVSDNLNSGKVIFSGINGQAQSVQRKVLSCVIDSTPGKRPKCTSMFLLQALSGSLLMYQYSWRHFWQELVRFSATVSLQSRWQTLQWNCAFGCSPGVTGSYAAVHFMASVLSQRCIPPLSIKRNSVVLRHLDIMPARIPRSVGDPQLSVHPDVLSHISHDRSTAAKCPRAGAGFVTWEYRLICIRLQKLLVTPSVSRTRKFNFLHLLPRHGPSQTPPSLSSSLQKGSDLKRHLLFFFPEMMLLPSK